MSKQQLRKVIKTKLSKISSKDVQSQSINVTSRLLQLPQFINASSVAVYMSMAQEVQTIDIIKQCFDQGKKVYLPKCNAFATSTRKKHHLLMLQLKSFEEVLNLQPQGKYKLLEPTQGKDILEEGDLDLIVVPGVAFSEDGSRIGHGAGYYDEFLNVYTKTYAKPYLVGIGLKEQLVGEITLEDHDWKVDVVIAGDKKLP